MNKKISFLTLFTGLIYFWITFSYNTLSNTIVDNASNNWYIISNNHTSIWSCNTDREKYNKIYSSYIRSDCFSNWGWFKYFICQAWTSCSLSESDINNLSLTTTGNVPNKDKLDAFLLNLSEKKDTMSIDNYNKLLTNIESKLAELSAEYPNNANLSSIIQYLKIWVAALKSWDSSDTVFCELLWNCWETVIQPKIWEDLVTTTECKSWMEEITLANWQTWSCKNLWATTVWLTSASYWNYYQWWRNDTGWTNWNLSAPYNFWWESQNDTKWGGSTSDTSTVDWDWTTSIWRQWPCDSGWHVPSAKDWQSLCNQVTWTTCINGMVYNSAISSVLKLPFAGYKYYNGSTNSQSTNANYWSSSPTSTNSYNLVFNTSIIVPTNSSFRADGLSVRCIKNTLTTTLWDTPPVLWTSSSTGSRVLTPWIGGMLKAPVCWKNWTTLPTIWSLCDPSTAKMCSLSESDNREYVCKPPETRYTWTVVDESWKGLSWVKVMLTSWWHISFALSWVTDSNGKFDLPDSWLARIVTYTLAWYWQDKELAKNDWNQWIHTLRKLWNLNFTQGTQSLVRWVWSVTYTLENYDWMNVEDIKDIEICETTKLKNQASAPNCTWINYESYLSNYQHNSTNNFTRYSFPYFMWSFDWYSNTATISYFQSRDMAPRALSASDLNQLDYMSWSFKRKSNPNIKTTATLKLVEWNFNWVKW